MIRYFLLVIDEAWVAPESSKASRASQKLGERQRIGSDVFRRLRQAKWDHRKADMWNAAEDHERTSTSVEFRAKSTREVSRSVY